MKSASSSVRVPARGKKMHRTIVRKQSERDQRIQRIHDDLELAIEDENVDVVPQPKKATPSVLRQQVTKADHGSLRKQSEGDQRMQRIHVDHKLAIKDVDINVVPPSKKGMPLVLPRQVTKANHVPCEECKREKAKVDPLGFHFCPNDEVVVGFRTKAGPIGPPLARKSGQNQVERVCPNDAVVVGFRTKAGPIAPPLARKSGQNPVERAG
ncbi:hypothetical protein ACJRO7_026961 [Eucalyptus globulus]|uniref:Uncharacterized protein n=1 Tax=Eucalyptus globulus TaxID=34317 RepID=A0ABD3JWW1_EUCGL